MKATRKIDILFWAICVCLILNSCTYEDCQGDERIDYIPAEFHNRIKGLETHSQWIFTDGKGNFDTLTAQGPVTQDFWKHKDVCVSQEKIERKFKWDIEIGQGCESVLDVSFIALHNGDNVSFLFENGLLSNESSCLGIRTDFFIVNSKFIDEQISDSVWTPYLVYHNVTKLPYAHRPYLQNQPQEFMLLNDLDGLIGYTLNGDTMRLTSLKK